RKEFMTLQSELMNPLLVKVWELGGFDVSMPEDLFFNAIITDSPTCAFLHFISFRTSRGTMSYD
ncbi:hypothetical protein J6590_105655, partial [Homalodisca vitripennis]